MSENEKYIESIEYIENLETLSIDMTETDLALIDSDMQVLKENMGYDASREDYMVDMIRKSTWQTIIEEKEKIDTIVAEMGYEPISYERYLQIRVKGKYNPKYLLNAPVVPDEKGDVDELEPGQIPLPEDHPLLMEISKLKDDLSAGRTEVPEFEPSVVDSFYEHGKYTEICEAC